MSMWVLARQNQRSFLLSTHFNPFKRFLFLHTGPIHWKIAVIFCPPMSFHCRPCFCSLLIKICRFLKRGQNSHPLGVSPSRFLLKYCATSWMLKQRALNRVCLKHRNWNCNFSSHKISFWPRLRTAGHLQNSNVLSLLGSVNANGN